MLKKFLFPLAVGTFLLVQGCTPADSLNSLFTDKDIIFDQALLGQWGDKDGNFDDGYMQLDKAGADGYRIIFVDKDGSKVEYDAHLGMLQGHRFLDAVPVAAPAHWSALPDSDLAFTNKGKAAFKPGLVSLGDQAYLEFAESGAESKMGHYKLRLRMAHWLCKVSVEGPVLNLNCLDEDWIKNHIEDANIHLAHEYTSSRKGGLVITASTSDLQKFALEHADDKDAFAWNMTAHQGKEKDPSGLSF